MDSPPQLFDPPLRHTKDVIKIVPDASLLSAKHIIIGLASLSSQTWLKKEAQSIWNERLRVINISRNKLVHNPH